MKEEIAPARLKNKKQPQRAKERHEKSNLRRLTITVHSQTAYHLRDLARISGHNDIGRVVDKLVRERQIALKGEGYERRF